MSAHKIATAYPESTAHITGNDIHDNSVGINANHASPENAYARYNNIYDNTIDGVLTCSDKLGNFVDFDATNNWWGDASGPYHATSNPSGTGNRVRSYNAKLWQTEGDHVDYDPWLGEPYAPTKTTGTATGTGTASFSPDSGALEGLTAVAEGTLPTAGKPDLVFPHGFFSFDIVGLTPGQTVTITIELPLPAPVGTEYWKCQNAIWNQIPIGDDDGDNVITIQLTDGGQGDSDGVANGVITDPGGLGVPPEVPTVTTKAASGVGLLSATLNMDYTVGGYSPVQVRFAYKKSANSEWSYTDWVSKAGNGTNAALLSWSQLAIDTAYDFKAELKYDDTVIEGATLHFTTDATTGACFIATAAYGTPTAEQIDVLREFRDVVLLESTVGSQFVDLYYQLSPPVADFIAGNELLRTLVRELVVDPIVWIVEATGNMWRN